jgi:hypothetical protein
LNIIQLICSDGQKPRDVMRDSRRIHKSQ